MKSDLQNTGKKVVFILSETRSGSTWLSYVLGSHADAVHLGEYQRPFSIPGHVACRLCQAKGRAECEFLYGIDKVAKENAFDFAFERFQKTILVDCSKQLGWLINFIGSNTFQIKIIHLLRDPRAWFASEKRRDRELTIDHAMKRWVSTNTGISKTINELSLSCVTAFYDELCIRPDHHFQNSVSKYIGMPFETSALDYWKKEHHGLGGNGAAFNNLKRYAQAKVSTGDDDYYSKHAGKHFYDSRWLEELSPTERNTIENMRIVNEYLSLHARDFTYFDMLLGEVNSPQSAR